MCIRMITEIMEMALPHNPSEIEDPVFYAIKIYLLLIEGLVPADDDERRKRLGWELVYRCLERFPSFYRTKITTNYYPSASTHSTICITEKEIKVKKNAYSKLNK